MKRRIVAVALSVTAASAAIYVTVILGAHQHQPVYGMPVTAVIVAGVCAGLTVIGGLLLNSVRPADAMARTGGDRDHPVRVPGRGHSDSPADDRAHRAALPPDAVQPPTRTRLVERRSSRVAHPGARSPCSAGAVGSTHRGVLSRRCVNGAADLDVVPVNERAQRRLRLVVHESAIFRCHDCWRRDLHVHVQRLPPGPVRVELRLFTEPASGADVDLSSRGRCRCGAS